MGGAPIPLALPAVNGYRNEKHRKPSKSGAEQEESPHALTAPLCDTVGQTRRYYTPYPRHGTKITNTKTQSHELSRLSPEPRSLSPAGDCGAGAGHGPGPSAIARADAL